MIQVIAPYGSDPAVRVVMTTRSGGVSQDPFHSLNLGFHVPDDAAAVLDNRRRAAEALQLPGRQAALGEQVHGSQVAFVGPGEAGRGWEASSTALPGVDALLTTSRGVALAVLVADCFPLVVWDAAAGALGVAHCGWRGVAGELPRLLVQALTRDAGAQAARCQAWIGAGIGPCCFQVGEEVLRQLPAARASPDEEGRWRLDLRAALRGQLVAAGLGPAAVQEASQCTSCETETFFSHRRVTRSGGTATGRQALFAWLA